MGKPKLAIIESILERTSAFHVNDDNPIDRDWLSDLIDDVRVKLIQEEYRSFRSVDPQYYQMQCCLEVKCEDMAVCTVSGITFASKEVIHYVDISNVVPGLGNASIRHIGIPDKTFGNEIYIGTLEAFNKISHFAYGSNSIIATPLGTKLYIRNLPLEGTRFLCMAAVLSKPEDACDFSDLVGYPVSNPDRLEYITWMRVMQALSIPADQINDTSDMLKMPGKVKPVQDEEQQNG